MDRLLLNPTLAHVNRELASMCGEVNHGCDARTAELRIDAGVWELPYVKDRAGGEGVPTSYCGRAETTVVGVCWISSQPDRREDGREDAAIRLVRIQVFRAPAPRSAGATRRLLPFGYNTAMRRWDRWDFKEYRGIIAAALPRGRHALAGLGSMGVTDTLYALARADRALVGDVIECCCDAVRLGVIADWLDEHGREWSATKIRISLDVVREEEDRKARRQAEYEAYCRNFFARFPRPETA